MPRNEIPIKGDSGANRPLRDTIVEQIANHDSPRILILGSGIYLGLEREIFRNAQESTIYSVDQQKGENLIGFRHHVVQADLNCEKPQHLSDKPFDFIIALELLEHLSDDSIFWQLITENGTAKTTYFISFPNLASIFSRLELLFGLQPHVLEASSVHHVAGMGIGGKFNYGSDTLKYLPIGHLRGITRKAFGEICTSQGFEVEAEWGYMHSINLWPRKFLVGLSGNILVQLRKRVN